MTAPTKEKILKIRLDRFWRDLFPNLAARQALAGRMGMARWSRQFIIYK